MTGYLARLAARVSGGTGSVLPRMPARFEPPRPAPGPLSEVDTAMEPSPEPVAHRAGTGEATPARPAPVPNGAPSPSPSAPSAVHAPDPAPTGTGARGRFAEQEGQEEGPEPYDEPVTVVRATTEVGHTRSAAAPVIRVAEPPRPTVVQATPAVAASPSFEGVSEATGPGEPETVVSISIGRIDIRTPAPAVPAAPAAPAQVTARRGSEEPLSLGDYLRGKREPR